MTNINIDTNANRTFHELKVKVAGKLAGECKCSGGWLGYCTCGHDPCGCNITPCPHCAKLRAMAEEYAHRAKCPDIYIVNKDAIVQALRDLGLFRGFYLWLGNKEFAPRCVEICLDDSMLLQAAISFLQEVVDER